jgi:hypothetical protein
MALSATELVVSRQGAVRADGARIPLASGPGDQGSWPELTAALRTLAASDGGGEVDIALLPPLIEVARLDLPPLSEAELVQLLSRNAGRYFVGARGSQTVGVIQRRGRRGAAPLVVAATAATRLVAAIDAAARASGWSVIAVTPAEAAWTAAAVALWPAFARRGAHVLVHEADRTVLLELQDGRLVNVRRFRSGGADADLIADALAAAGTLNTSAIGAFGVPSGRQELLRALSARGITARTATGPWAEHSDMPAMLAAAFAGASRGPLLMNEQARTAWRARVQKATIAVAALAALFVIIAAIVTMWGVHRDLKQVQAQRTAVHPMVAATLIGRSTVEDAYRRLAALADAQRAAPHWAPVLADLSELLPDDAFLTAFRTRGDSLTVDGMAAHAASVFDAIHDSQLLSNVRAPAPVRAEAPEGGNPLERFTIAATMRSSVPPPVPTAKTLPKPAGAQ